MAGTYVYGILTQSCLTRTQHSSSYHQHNHFPTAGSDYEAVTVDFTFVTGSSNGDTMSFAVPIIGDEMGEPAETFIIQITPSTPDVVTSATITILNDDSKECYNSSPVCPVI